MKAGSAASDGHLQADYQSLQQAAEWYALLHGGTATPQQRRNWNAWLLQRPEHRQAWRHIEAVSRRFEPLRTESEREASAAAIQVSAQPVAGRRQVLGGLAVLGTTGLLGWLAWPYSPAPALLATWRADYHAGIGEQRDILLADGTRVWLNTGSALDVDYSGSQRLLTLAMGEILVDTGADGRKRPFFVQTRFGSMQALGTHFAVRHTSQHTLIAVFSGSVRIRNTAGATEVVPAGQQRQFTRRDISAAQVADPAREAWSRGFILADDITLAALAAEIGQYRRGYLTVAPEVASLRVVGRYPANDTDLALAMLERNLPIRVRRTLPWWTTIEAR